MDSLEPRDNEELNGVRRLRVVHCIDNFGGGGTELNLVRTLERLDRKRFDLSLVALNETGPLRARIDKTGVPVHVFSFPSLGSATAIRRAAQLMKWFRTIKPDVVHCHDRYTNLFVTPCARLAGVPMVITSKRWWTVSSWIYRRGNQLAYRLSHRVLTNSAAVANLLTHSEGVAHDKIVILPNFVEDAAFDRISSEDRGAARRAFGIPEDSMVVTAVANLRPVKDLETLIRATALLRARHPSLHVLLAGSGPSAEDLRNAAFKHGVGDRIHFSGYLASPPNPHQYGDVSVLCSLHEGSPNSVIEAMAAGRPVVATAVGGIPEAVQDGVTGLLVPPRSPADLAAAIDRLIVDEGLRRSMGRAGRERARADFAAGAVLERLSQLYVDGR
ncbi:MAG TPA: glycosyltransferase [Roseiarcus sp.]|nr:glycosyltransferase [Roseiarcus sp.]